MARTIWPLLAHDRMYQKGYVALTTKKIDKPQGGVGVPGEILIFVTLVRLDRICMLKSKE
jgi:hypothetical protein